MAAVAEWARFMRKAMRLAFKRRCWAALGTWLRVIKQGGRVVEDQPALATSCFSSGSLILMRAGQFLQLEQRLDFDEGTSIDFLPL